jgi:hypothetical protein
MADDVKTTVIVTSPPIPREETPTPDPVMTALAQIMIAQKLHGERLESVVNSQADLVTRVSQHADAIKKLQDATPPDGNAPPRTNSGFIAAVNKAATEIATKTTRNSEAEMQTRFEILESNVAEIKSEMGLQTKMLGTLVDGLGSFARNPTVRKIAYVAGGLVLGYLSHLAALKGFSQ